MNLRHISIHTLLGTTAIMLLSCSTRPDYVLDPDDMAALLADIHTGEAVVENNFRHYDSDSSRSVLRQSIYAKHGVDAARVDSSMMWYGQHMDEYLEVYERTIDLLNADIAKAQEDAGSNSTDMSNQTFAFEGDSVDVWTDIRYRRLSANMPSEFIAFSLNSDNNWEKGDAYEFKYKLLGVHGTTRATLMAEYHNGTREYVSQNIGNNGWNSIKLVLDSTRTPYNVSGFIHYQPVKGEVAYIDSISLTRTRWGAHKKALRNNVKIFNLKK